MTIRNAYSRAGKASDVVTPATAHSPFIERLESREMMSVSHDADGWTVIAPASDSRIVYVSSSSGNDANSGLSPSSPVRSLAHGSALLRDGSADELLLKRGDTWHEGLGVWTKSGRSTNEPMVIGTYGSGARPLLETGTAGGLTTGSASHKTVQHLSIIGLNFWADGRDPSTPGYNKNSNPIGLQLIAAGGDLLIEDCRVQGYQNNIAVTDLLGPVSNVTVRRSEILDAYSATTEHSQGFYADGVNGLTLDGNVIDHNGWSATVPGAVATVFNHDAYLTARNTGVVVVGNIFSNASSHGLQARSGGIVHGNLFVDDPLGMTYGLVNGAGVITAGGVSGEVTDNVFLGAGSLEGTDRGVAIDIANIKAGGNTVVSGNIFARYTDGPFAAISLNFGVGTNASQQVGINDLTVSNNIAWHWTAGLSVAAGMSPTGVGSLALHVTVQNNDFTQTDRQLLNGIMLGNVHAATSVHYPDPDRTLSMLDAAVGGPESAASFLTQARNNYNGNWQPYYTAQGAVDYVRGGFGLAATSSTPGIIPMPSPTPTPTSPSSSPSGSSKKSQKATPTPAPTPPIAVPTARIAGKPPTVKSLKLKRLRHGVVSVTVRFSADIGASLERADLVLTDMTGQVIDLSAAALQYNARICTAIWTFGGMASGRYQVRISSGGVQDAAGRTLDGNHDGASGDDYLLRQLWNYHAAA